MIYDKIIKHRFTHKSVLKNYILIITTFAYCIPNYVTTVALTFTILANNSTIVSYKWAKVAQISLQKCAHVGKPR